MITYEKLTKLSKEIKILNGISSVLNWDQETYMPREGGEIRGEQLSLLASLSHKKLTSKLFQNTLGELIDLKSGRVLAKKLSTRQKAALKMWRRDFNRATALPNRFVSQFTKLIVKGVEVWKEAKPKEDYKSFAKILKQIVEACRQKAEYIGYKAHPYDALLDEYEPGATTKEIEQLFTGLAKRTRALLQEMASKPQVDNSFLSGNFPHDKQLHFGKLILKAMGYDFAKGRLDLSAHPFSSSSHPTDSRITTRIHPESLVSNILACLHEGGHSLYDMGVPKEEYGTPLGEALSLGIHESQSRFWETRIGQSLPFWEHFFPKLQAEFPEKLKKVSLEQFYRGLNLVEPSFIRVEADEVTYSLHVILRFEIEKALIENSLNVDDIPDVWNEKMKHYLGITPKTLKEGCMQDIHWPWGAFGYFPSYTLGNLYSACLFEKFEKDHTDWKKKVREGNLIFIKDWLGEKVHRHGREFLSRELIENATSAPFSEAPYSDYLENKYKEIYRL